MPVSAEADHGRLTELANGMRVARAPLVRLDDALYLFIVAHDPHRAIPMARRDGLGGAPRIGTHWQVSAEAEIAGEWSGLEYHEGGGSAASGTNGTQFLTQHVFVLPADADPPRLRLRYGLDDMAAIEESIALR